MDSEGKFYLSMVALCGAVLLGLVLAGVGHDAYVTKLTARAVAAAPDRAPIDVACALGTPDRDICKVRAGR